MYTIVRNHVDHVFSEYFRIIEMFWSDSPRLVVSDDAREADKATPSSQLWSKISDVNPHIWCWSTWHIRKTRNDVFEAQKELADKKRAMEEGKRPSPYSFKPLTGCKVVAYAIAATVGGPLQALRRHFAYCCFGSRCVLVWGGLTWVITMHCFSSTVEAVQSRKNTKKQFRQKHHERPQPKSIWHIPDVCLKIFTQKEKTRILKPWAAAADVFGDWPNRSLGSGRRIAKQMASCSTTDEIHSEGQNRSHECTMVDVTEMSYIGMRQGCSTTSNLGWSYLWSWLAVFQQELLVSFWQSFRRSSPPLLKRSRSTVCMVSLGKWTPEAQTWYWCVYQPVSTFDCSVVSRIKLWSVWVCLSSVVEVGRTKLLNRFMWQWHQYYFEQLLRALSVFHGVLIGVFGDHLQICLFAHCFDLIRQCKGLVQ